MNDLERLIHEEIRRSGPITFRRFMELVLYHPQLGYYRRDRDPFGRGGDYFTSSQLQPVFGRLLAQQFAAWRREMGDPSDFQIVEMGAGRGETLDEVRGALPGVFCTAIDLGSRETPRRMAGVVYCNEFFDALPVHVAQRKGTAIVELYVELRQGVDSREGRLQWTEGEPSSDALTEYVKRYTPGLADKQKIEVNLAALQELENISRWFKRGYLLIIDYGYTAEQIAAGRRFPQGSLMSYAKHQAFDDVLREPGEHDITSHVNFTALEERAKELGFSSSGLQTQAQFLLQIGEEDEFQTALRAASEQESLQLGMQLKSLLFGMGETFQVLILRK